MPSQRLHRTAIPLRSIAAGELIVRHQQDKTMSFVKESTGYEKTILSDLQGAWSLLRSSVVDAAGFEGWDRTTFHIDEAMSWESVRNLMDR